jgi:hypothetical protein
MIAAVTTTRPTAVGLGVLRDVVRADAACLMLPVDAAWRCQHVCGSWYADDMRRLVASRSVSGWPWSGDVARPVPSLPLEVQGDWTMITLGIDAHTVVAVDEVGRQLATRSTTTTAGHLALVPCAEQLDRGHGREWAVEDSRHLSRRLEADLLGAGERITVPTVDLAEAA